MIEFANLLHNNNFVKTLVDSLPCGFLVVDKDGRVQLVNNILERVLKVSKKAAVGKGTGNALGCLHVSDHPSGCGFGECCKDCEVQKLTFDSLSTNQSQRTRAQLKIIIDGQVRDLTLLISASPFTLDDERFCILIIEDLVTLRAFTPTDTRKGFRGIVGQSDSMLELFATIRQIARTDAPVLIQGESGTGKELVALAVHKESPRARNHFVPVNCAALPEGLLETELFGHVKGAFTGAHRDRKGRFEIADGGTIFLDEVAELKPDIQVKLLRVLEDGSFEPVGSEKTIRVNVRVISATNKKLEEEVTAGRFRQDLYYRLCVMPIVILPLRDRSEDLPLLVEHFITQFSEETKEGKIVLCNTALDILQSHPWPGNVRELINTIKFALVKCNGSRIKPEHLPPTLQLNISRLYPLQVRESKLHAADVVKALKKAKGNKCRAAQILGVSRSTLYRFFANQPSA
ncbi:MAG: sigma-54 interaction domain-containing protein [Desulfobacterales bacterium]